MLKPLLLTLFLLFVPLVLLRFERKPWKRVFDSLSVTPFPKLLPTIKTTLKILALFYALLLVEGFLLQELWDTAPVITQIKSLSSFALVLAVTLGPLSEEIFFRGFLQPRLGLFLTSVGFAAAHYGFGSFAEIAAAFTAAMVLGFYFNKTRNLYSCVLAHAAYNASSILLVHALGL